MSVYLAALKAQAARFDRAARAAREAGSMDAARRYAAFACYATMAERGQPVPVGLSDLAGIEIPADGDSFPFKL